MPPLGKIRISYELRNKPQGMVEVLVDGSPVAELSATEVASKIKPGDVGTITVTLVAERLDGEGHSP